MDATIYTARVDELTRIRGIYTLKLCLVKLDAKITIDIHNELCETLGVSKLSISDLQKIFALLPAYVKVTHKNGYWEIINGGYMLSNCLANFQTSD